jgi:type I restriction enzyme R subunit
MNKKELTEAEIRTRYITPSILHGGWEVSVMREEFFYFTKGRIDVRGKQVTRRKAKKVDYLLMRQDGTNTPLAVVEAKDNNHAVGDGIQQALDYAEALDVPFVFTSNGDSFLMHDRTGLMAKVEEEIALEDFPTPQQLEGLYKKWRGIDNAVEPQVLEVPYHEDTSGKQPRYYQRIAINRALEAIAQGQKRILLVMATGTGKTYTAAQIIWRYWHSPSHDGKQRRILFLADRNILVDQTKTNDFKHFGSAMTKISSRNIDKSYEVYLSLYQAISGNEEDRNAYKQFDRNFFDLIVVDECHRGSAKENSNWREILDYFGAATQIGMTATPIETKDASSSNYFGDPVYTYSLRQGIDDGFLAPYKVIRVATDVDTFGWRPEEGATDDEGNEIEDQEYTTKDYDRTIILPERDKKVAEYLTKFLAKTDPYAKTIVFARTIDQAERLRRALVNLNPEKVRENSKYVMRITGDDETGKAELDNFIDPESKYPVIATTSKLLSTGVDAQTCKVIVLDSNIASMTEFKQIIGRGTRVREDYGKTYFTILDFRNVTKLFADPDFDGDPVKIFEPKDEAEFEEVVERIDSEAETSLGVTDETTMLDEYPVEFPEDSRTHRVIHTVSGQEVNIIGDTVRIMGTDGKLITENLTDYTRKNILGEYATLNDFLQTWTHAKQKYYILDEMEEKGIPVHSLGEQFGEDADMFDVIVSIAYGQKPLDRKTRAEKVRTNNFLNKYKGKAREVLDALIDKYETTNLRAIEETDILKVQPLSNFGTPMEIANAFGGIDKYELAVTELGQAIYEEAR